MASSPAVAAVTETAVTTAGANHTISLPAGGAATDLYLILMDIGSTLATVNALANWTELLDESAANGLKIIYYTGSGVPSDPTFVTSANTRSATLAYRITGADKLIAPQIGTTGTGTSATPDPPSVTPTGSISKPYLFIALAGMAGEEADDDTWGNTPPTNYTPSPPRQKSCGTVGTNLGGLILAAERALTTGSAEDPGTFGVDVSAAWRSQTVIVHPLFSGTAAASNTTPRATATGTKGGTSTATETNTTPRTVATGTKAATSSATASNTTPRVTATGGKDFASTATATNTTPRATATGLKGGQSTAEASEPTHVVATGEASVAETHSGSASCSAAARITTSGQKDTQNSTTVTASTRTTSTGTKDTASSSAASNTTPRAIATGVKGGQGAATSSNSTPRATSTGAKAAQSSATVTGSPRTTTTGTKAASGSATATGRGQVTTSGSTAEFHQGSASCSGNASSTAGGTKGGQGTATQSAATQTTASGTKDTQGTASSSSAGRTTTSGTKGTQGEAAASNRATVIVAGQKAVSGIADVSVGGRVTVSFSLLPPFRPPRVIDLHNTGGGVGLRSGSRTIDLRSTTQSVDVN